MNMAKEVQSIGRISCVWIPKSAKLLGSRAVQIVDLTAL